MFPIATSGTLTTGGGVRLSARSSLRPSRLWAPRVLAHRASSSGAPSRRVVLFLPVLAASSAAVAGDASASGTKLRLETDSRGVQRLALQREGWDFWEWRGHRVNYVAAGDKGPIVLLIHGFGASVYHWRYNIPELSQHCRVYALDCLGFGWSSKPLVDYRAYGLWEEQITDFIREVIGGDEKVVLVGNSLGGYNSLAAAARAPELVKGVVLLNAAGRFQSPEEIAAAAAAAGGEAAEAAAPEESSSLWSSFVESITTSVKRGVVLASFVYTKNPLRIKQVLRQVYHRPDSIDEDLVESIELPAQDPNAAEVFYRIITGRGRPVNQLLDQMNGMPLLLLWGSQDPWCVPARATQIEQYYPLAERIDIESGHCPHDDTPELVNGNLLSWVNKLA